jgi:hypothetical protein
MPSYSCRLLTEVRILPLVLKLKTMRPRIKKGILVTSTTLSRRAEAFKNVVEVTYRPLMFGNKIVSEKVLGARTKAN